MRAVFWRIDFRAAGPGAALTDILGRSPNALAMAQVIVALRPDVLLLSGIDHDARASTAQAFAALIADTGHALPYILAPRSNAGLHSGLDLNGDGLKGTPDDAQGYGEYAGARSVALLSRYPFAQDEMQDFTSMLWRDLPDALLFTGATEAQLQAQRLSSTAHFAVPIVLPDGTHLWIMAYQAGPPVFGDHPDKNLNRNHDETAFWSWYLSGALGASPPDGPFVLMGGSNLDPQDGDGLSAAMQALLAHPRLQDPRPTGRGGARAADPAHLGPPGLDTVDWDAPQGNLRVAYVLPSADLTVLRSGIFWPEPASDLARLLEATGTAHKPVWVDLRLN